LGVNEGFNIYPAFISNYQDLYDHFLEEIRDIKTKFGQADMMKIWQVLPEGCATAGP
jgi:hypothetical protein